MNRQPVLEGGRLTLRPLHADDWDALFAVASDPAIWAGHPARDRWQEPVFRAYFAEALASGGALAVVERASGAIVGSSRYGQPEATGPGEIEIGWTFLAHRLWGTGLNAEMKRLMVGHALAHFDTVIFQVGGENVISRSAMANVGAALTGRTQRHERGGVVIEHVLFAITRDAFARGPLATD